MRFKSGVVLYDMDCRVQDQLHNGSELDQAFHRSAGRDCIITGGREGKHRGDSYRNGSGHYKGNALDLRTRDMNARQIEDTEADLRFRLGDDWFILVEATHIHLEIDEAHRYAR